jgi:diguanylate cyclase (GGDEF)-like protein
MFTISFVLTSTLLTCINLLTSKKKINEKWFQINLNIIALFLIVIATTNSSIAITKVLEDDRFQIPKPPLIMFNILFIVIGVVTLITINISFFKKKKYDVIERKSKLDLMTGMFNHASGKEELVTVIAKSKNINQIITLCYIDINKLKYVNDNFGHSKGDKVILTVTNVIKDNLRRNDLVIRLGGDEILLALVGCDYNDSESIVRRMQIELAEFTGNSYTISFSYGLREVSPSEDTDLEKAIIEADNMMYAQKSG